MIVPVFEGAVIDQRYHLGRVVRESPVAVVYEALHRNGAEAWVKLPRTPEHGGALLAEARIANALGKNAVSLRDDGVTEDGLLYLVLEPVTGQRLDHWRRSHEGRAPVDEAMGVGDELCEAIGTMHAAGYAIGALRADAILVLPKGGVCLLELEHARPASPSAIKEDVVRVGRVLYEMLAGAPCVAHPAPLHDAAPELPTAMTTTIDGAVRGRYATIGELQSALRASIPAGLGPRKPTPSVAPEALASDASLERRPAFEGIVLPRASRPLFDPDGDLGAGAHAERLSPAGGGVASVRLSSAPGRASDASPIAAFAQLEARSRPRRSLTPAIAGAAALVGLIGVAIVIARFATNVDEPAQPVAKAMSVEVRETAAAAPARPPSGELAAPPPLVTAAPPGAVLEVDAVPSPGRDEASATIDAAGPADDGEASETTLRFKGDLSPRYVIVDGVVMGITTKSVTVNCGRRSVKIGAKGTPRTLDLPCGGEQGIRIERNGKWRDED